MKVRGAGLLLLCVAACGDDDDEPDARLPDPVDGAVGQVDAAVDASPDAGPPVDAAPVVYNCGEFEGEPPTWTISPGFHAVVVADAADGLSQPVAVTTAGGAFGGALYVVNQGGNTLLRIDPETGASSSFVSGAAWATAPSLLTGVVWDAGGVFDGNLYVGDQGGDGDADSRIYRVTPAGATSVLAAAPGPAMDDIFAMAFSPGGDYPTGLIIGGDTDGAGPDWASVSSTGVVTAFSELGGGEGAAFDRAGTYGGGLFAARPAGGGYPGDDTVGRIKPDGTADVPLATGLPGVHGIAFAPAGPFGGRLHVASWSAGTLSSIAPGGEVTVLASGLSLTNYGANMLAFSPDGLVLYVADRAANRLVCLEPIRR